MRFEVSGTRAFWAPKGHLVEPGDILPTRAQLGDVNDTPGSRGSEPCPFVASPFQRPQVSVLLSLSAGAYPLRRPPNAWSPGVLAPPGPCYWLVASGTPMGRWRGCLAAVLLSDVLHHYCLGGCSALLMCSRHSQQVRTAGLVPLLVPPSPCRPSLASLAELVAGSLVWVSPVLA